MSATLLLVGLVAVALALLLAPVETLGWWAGWFEGERERRHPTRGFTLEVAARRSSKRLFVVFLDGIARADSRENLLQVERFVGELAARLPEAEVIRDLFPYSVTGVPLTEQRPLSRLWRLANARKRTARWNPVGFLLNLRNLFQVAASADRRYAPVYFQGVTQLLLDTLLQRGYDPTRPAPIVLIGYSGGAQMALGAAPYLQRVLGIPVRVISVGGVMSAPPLLDEIEHLDHLVGSRDLVEGVGAALFPRRWRVLPLTPWQRARREGRVRIHCLGPMRHVGGGSYLDGAVGAAGSNIERTLGATVRLVRQALAAVEAPVEGAASAAALDEPRSLRGGGGHGMSAELPGSLPAAPQR